MKDGGYGFEVMSMEDVRAHARRYSKAYDSGPWKTNFEEMAKKTVLKRVLKYAPLKSDFQRAIAQDATIKTEISEDMYSVAAVPTEDYSIETEFSEIPTDPATGEVLDGQTTLE
jgi:recombination protein RecT